MIKLYHAPALQSARSRTSAIPSMVGRFGRAVTKIPLTPLAQPKPAAVAELHPKNSPEH